MFFTVSMHGSPLIRACVTTPPYHRLLRTCMPSIWRRNSLHFHHPSSHGVLPLANMSAGYFAREVMKPSKAKTDKLLPSIVDIDQTALRSTYSAITLLSVAVISLPIWIPFVSESMASGMQIGALCVMSVFGITTMQMAAKTHKTILLMRNAIQSHSMTKNAQDKFSGRAPAVAKHTVAGTNSLMRGSKVNHFVIIPAFTEGIDVLSVPLSSLRAQSVANSTIHVVVSIEETSPERETVKKQVLHRFSAGFVSLQVVFHPFGIPGEVPGACSNVNYGAQVGLHNLERLFPGFTTTPCLVTKMDADTLVVYSHYFELLTEKYLIACEEGRGSVTSFQPIISFADGSLGSAPFFVRGLCLVVGIGIHGEGFPNSFQHHSVYSFPLDLMKRIGWWDPAAIAEETALAMRTFITTKGKWTMEQVYLPVVTPPTFGRTYLEHYNEMAKQQGRWGSSDLDALSHFLCLAPQVREMSLLKYSKQAFKYIGGHIIDLVVFPLFLLFASTIPHLAIHCYWGQESSFLETWTGVPWPWLWTGTLVAMGGPTFAYGFFIYERELSRYSKTDEPRPSILRDLFHIAMIAVVLPLQAYIRITAMLRGMSKPISHELSRKRVAHPS